MQSQWNTVETFDALLFVLWKWMNETEKKNKSAFSFSTKPINANIEKYRYIEMYI